MKTSNQKKQSQQINRKKILKICICVLVGVTLLVMGTVSYLYFFPTGKLLFAWTHYNLLEDVWNMKEPERYSRALDMDLDISGDLSGAKLLGLLDATSIHVNETKWEKKTADAELALRYNGADILNAEYSVRGDKAVFHAPQLSKDTYSGESVGEIVTLLMGKQGLDAEKSVSDGVNRGGLKQYILSYGLEWFRSVPDGAFSKKSEHNNKKIILSGKTSKLVSPILKKMKHDTSLRSFLYRQRDKIADNLHSIYAGTKEMMPKMTESEFYAHYAETLDQMIRDMEAEDTDLQVETIVNKKRRIVRESAQITKNGETLFSCTLDEDGNCALWMAKDGETVLDMKNEVKKDGPETYTTFFLAAGDKKDETKQYFGVKANAITNTTVTEEALPLAEEYLDLKSLSAEEKQEIAEDADKRFIKLLASMAWNIIINR